MIKLVKLLIQVIFLFIGLFLALWIVDIIDFTQDYLVAHTAIQLDMKINPFYELIKTIILSLLYGLFILFSLKYQVGNKFLQGNT
jgi:hypothetical protein